MDNVSFSVILTHDDHASLMKHCIKRDVSRTGMIRALLKEALKKKWFDKVNDFGAHQKFRSTKTTKPKVKPKTKKKKKS